MSDKPEALQMADELDSLCDPYDSAIAAELRRLHALNAELVGALRKCDEAMAWDLGGEPLDTLMTDARNAARAALAKVGESK